MSLASCLGGLASSPAASCCCCSLRQAAPPCLIVCSAAGGRFRGRRLNPRKEKRAGEGHSVAAHFFPSRRPAGTAAAAGGPITLPLPPRAATRRQKCSHATCPGRQGPPHQEPEPQLTPRAPVAVRAAAALVPANLRRCEAGGGAAEPSSASSIAASPEGPRPAAPPASSRAPGL